MIISTLKYTAHCGRLFDCQRLGLTVFFENALVCHIRSEMILILNFHISCSSVSPSKRLTFFFCANHGSTSALFHSEIEHQRAFKYLVGCFILHLYRWMGFFIKAMKMSSSNDKLGSRFFDELLVKIK